MRFLDLIIKYDVTGPRYTSYPPLPYWEHPPSQEEWLAHVNQGSEVDLYVHIPFCKNICHYCGCNRIKLCDESDLDTYIGYLLKEWELYKKKCPLSRINSLHLGGGSPSLLSVLQLDRLLGPLIKDIDKSKLNGSIEIDPRNISSSQLQKIFDYGIRRLSFGIQDFDQTVQEKIGRVQPFEKVSEILRLARMIGFKDINFDLIYGLPGQTIQRMGETFKQVVTLKPDTVAFYSFAFVPHFATNQNNIFSSDLLQGIEKWRLLETGRNWLFKSGYREVGMDHYALEGSTLFKALKNGNLYRNFMGYVNHKVDTVIGLGYSAISSTGKSFAQNSKDFLQYYNLIDKGIIPFIKGHIKTEDDLKTESIIHEIMCKQKLNLNSVDVAQIQGFINDKIMKIEGDQVIILEAGKSFLRNICMQFDKRLSEVSKNIKFSRTI